MPAGVRLAPRQDSEDGVSADCYWLRSEWCRVRTVASPPDDSPFLLVGRPSTRH